KASPGALIQSPKRLRGSSWSPLGDRNKTPGESSSPGVRGRRDGYAIDVLMPDLGDQRVVSPRRGLEAPNIPADDALGEGRLADEGPPRIPAAAEGARKVADPQGPLAIRGGEAGRGAAGRQDPRGPHPRAVSRRVGAVGRRQADGAPLVPPYFHDPR